MSRTQHPPRRAAAAALLASAALPIAVAASPAARRAPGALAEPAAAIAGTAALDRVIVVEGRRETGEASVSTAAMKYLPFDVPAGVTKITVRKEFDHGPDAAQKNTVDLGLFDPRGYGRGGPGFRAWQGGVPQDLVIAGTPEASSTHGVPGPIPAGRWHLAQYFLKSTPAGLGYRYTITLSFGGPKPPKTAPKPPAYDPGVLNPSRGWYAGNLHTHTLHSDGARTLPELARRVRDAGFDFMASTEHNSPTAHFRFPEAARAAPGLLLLHGDELTTPGGHANILGQKPGHWFDFRMDPGDGRMPAVIDEAHRQGALFVVNHPYATCTSCTWKYPEAEWAAKADAIEVWNGAWTAEDREAVDNWDRLLKRGSRLRAWGGTDYHRGEEPMVPASLVYADNLSTRKVLDGLKRGRVLLTEGPQGPRVFVTPAGKPDALPGDTVRAAGRDAATLPVTVRVTGGRGMTVRLVWATGEVRLPTVASDDATLSFDVPLTGSENGYVRAELLRPLDLVAALTNPLFIDRR